MARIYHLLDGGEPFSERYGGAISRWIAHVLEDGDEIIVCPSFDGSWDLPSGRLLVLKGRGTGSILPRIPWSSRRSASLSRLAPLIAGTRAGDLLYVHDDVECAALLAGPARERGLRMLLHMHSSGLLRATRAQLEALRGVPVVFCSEYLRSEFHQEGLLSDVRSHVVYSGADDRRFYPNGISRNSVPEILYSGRLASYKGVHVLIEAMKILEGRGVRTRCTIVGGGAPGALRRSGYIRRLRRMAGASTTLAGHLPGDELAQRLRHADIFCFPTLRDDPFPQAPIEAMASGLPVVASNTGGIPEALAYGGGIMVPPNDPGALAAKLEFLVGDRSYRLRLGSEAEEAFRQHFRWTTIRRQYEAVITGVMQEGAGRGAHSSPAPGGSRSSNPMRGRNEDDVEATRS